MTIAYISNSIIPSRSANSIHVMKMCQAFANNGHSVYLFVHNKDSLKEKGIDDVYSFYGVKNSFRIVEIDTLDLKYASNILYSVSVMKRISKIKPDLVYGRDLLSCFVCTKKSYTIYEAHSPINTSIQKYIFNRLAKNNNCLKIVVISNALKRIISENQKINASKILVAHDGADEAPNFKGFLQPSKNIRVGYFGHLYKGRGIDILLKIALRIPDVEFHIVGGNNEDIDYWKRSQTSCKNLYFHGFVEPRDVYAYRNSCDILIAPYQKKVAVSGGKGNTSNFMSPLKVFEYMSSKKAIIVSDLPVLREVLNEENSILVGCDNIEKWVTSINLLRQNEFRDKLGNKAYEDFVNNYSWNQRAINVINDIIS